MEKQKKSKILGVVLPAIVILVASIVHIFTKAAKKTTYKVNNIEDRVLARKKGIYEKYIKRGMDIICAILALLCFGWLYFIVAILVKFKLGSPVLFTQDRPGMVDPNTGKETIFKMYKFRTMTEARDKEGNLLPDEARLTRFGAWLRSTSLDELPEAFNLLNGTMSVVGPRPQLVRDMIFMSPEQRIRHTAKPGMSGLAQVNGRNAITWEDKIAWDIKYINRISLFGDISIIIQTVNKAFLKKEGITDSDMVTAEDLGDYLLKTGKVTREEYDEKQALAKAILNGEKGKDDATVELESHEPFSVAMSVYKNDTPDFFDRALNSITEMQTIKPDEIVLVVDGPIGDELNFVIDKYANQYDCFNIIRLDQNCGLGNALKIAVENAKNTLIARMDSDDVSVPSRFEEQLKYFVKYPEIDIVGGDITEFIGEETHVVGRRTVPKNNDEIKEYMKTRCAMNHVSVMYRKSAVQAAGGYQDWFWNEDYYLWIRMWMNGAVFANTGTVLVNVRTGIDMYRRRGGKKYFESEKGLQKYMLKSGVIDNSTYIVNVLKRWVVQIILPAPLRGWVFKTFARN